MTELVSTSEAAVARLALTVEKARDFAALSQAANTARAYKADREPQAFTPASDRLHGAASVRHPV